MERIVHGLGQRLILKNWMLATAESCTGGLVGHLLTTVSGSSTWYLGGVVSYSNELKRRLLGVSAEALEAHGTVSEPVVRAMAQGALKLGADVSLAISGVAGPTGGTPEKPVGTVWLAWAGPFGVEAEVRLFQGDRLAIKTQSAEAAIRRMADLCS
ncbi:MAG: CinA family protein [Desulfovibrionaceae bacterium]